jgi:hypothetical protein
MPRLQLDTKIAIVDTIRALAQDNYINKSTQEITNLINEKFNLSVNYHTIRDILVALKIKVNVLKRKKPEVTEGYYDDLEIRKRLCMLEKFMARYFPEEWTAIYAENNKTK